MPSEQVVDEASARDLGIALRGIRETRGLTQEEVAHRAGVSRNYYQLLEHGLSDRHRQTPANPTLRVLIDLSRALDAPLVEIVADLDKDQSR